MIKKIMLILIVLSFGVLCAQSNVSKSVKLKGIAEIAREHHPELFLPKDEFETNAEYKQRVKKQKTLIKELKNELLANTEARKKERSRLAKEQAAEDERKLQIKIAESLAPVKFSPTSLGKYNAENNTFPLTIDGNSYTVKVPRSEARDFKKNFSLVKIEGYKQLTRDLQSYKYFDMVAIHPITGSRFSFGPTKTSSQVLITVQTDNIREGPSTEYSIIQKCKQGEVYPYLGAHGKWWKIQTNSGIAYTHASNGKIITADIPVKLTQNIIPPDLRVQLAFSEPSGDDRLDAEETAELIVTIQNNGQGSAFGVEILCALTGSRAVEYPKSAYIGEIPPSKSRTKRLPLKASENVGSGKVSIALQFKESNNFEPNNQKITFETEALIPPKLKIVDIGVDDFSRNAIIEPGETVGITVRVQNLGNGSADDVKAAVHLVSSNIFFYGKSPERFNLGSLAPGAFADFTFDLVSNKKAKDMPISVTVTESRGRFGISDYALDLVFDQVQQSVGEMTIAGKYEEKGHFTATTGLSIDIEKEVPIAKHKNKNALAIIFGVENYKNVSPVTFAKRDASIIKEYFTNSLGIPLNRIYFQTNDDVSKAEFDKVFSKDGWLDKRVKMSSDIFIYFAGHGAPDIKNRKAYLMPHDGDPNYPSQTGFSIDDMYKKLNKLGANSITVFLDACFSGANRESEMLLADARPVFIEVDASMTGNVTVFSASSGSEISSAGPENKHGLFSYFLMKGIRGDADANNDNQITVGELGNYIKENVSDMAGMLDREQTPGLQTLDREKILIRY